MVDMILEYEFSQISRLIEMIVNVIVMIVYYGVSLSIELLHPKTTIIYFISLRRGLLVVRIRSELFFSLVSIIDT